MAGWLHGVFVGDWLFVFPLCGFSLSLFCNYICQGLTYTRRISTMKCPTSTRCAPCAANSDGREWTAALQDLGVPAQLWPDDFEPEGRTQLKLDAVTFAICWSPPPGLLRKCPNLVAVHALGAGVDSVLPEVPSGIPLSRIVRPSQALDALPPFCMSTMHLRTHVRRRSRRRQVSQKHGEAIPCPA